MMGGSEASEYADAGQSNNLGLRRWAVLGWPSHGRISQASVDSVFVVIIDIFAQQAMQVSLKTLAVPTDDCVGLDDDQDLFPT